MRGTQGSKADLISGNGWAKYWIWEHSRHVRDLYARRCRLEVEEMTCHAQAAEILKPYVSEGDTVLDVGCGSGYFYHSLRKRNISARYLGIDAAPSLVEIGRKCMPKYGLDKDSLQVMRIEDLDGEVDHIVCLNVLTNIDNYHRPLERLLMCASKTVILRESCSEKSEYLYVRDPFLDSDVNLKVHINTYCLAEIVGFMESYGYTATPVVDRYTNDEPQEVIGYPHRWKFLVAVKEKLYQASKPSNQHKVLQ